ncbi:hypothetical protein KSP35_08590 [Aquihabitans sp. G128]|uniref:hypothetical protein n=1 Tax=Aquihabitans sp. G128 TaxID=2849779 RepID=UPI001C2449E7|nr:hypothetical protein [Aquihabitans sp. G128]QXC62819.1 hypothetical protein KSP35_08590 [Aquihabitans sp. G128]
MITIAGWCLALALVSTVVGLPITAIRRSSLTAPLALLVGAFATGLVVLLVELTILNWLGGAWFAVSVAALVVVVGAALRRQGFAGLPPVVRRVDPWLLAIGAVLAGATLIRLRSVNYISRGGDAGGYVNWANQYARTGVLTSGFPPLFPMLLGLTSRVAGSAHTTDTVPLLGVLLLLVTLRLLGQLHAPAPVKLAATLLVALHTHAVWYSSFPMSEALQAPLIVMLLSNLVAIAEPAEGRQPVGELLTIGLIALAIGLCRVTAPLLVVPMFVLLAASAARPWRRYTSALAAASAAILAGVSLSYVYGITAIRPYYVDNQIGGTVSPSTFSRLDRLGLLEVGPLLVGLMVAGTAVLAGAAWLTRPGTRWTGRGPSEATAEAGGSPWWWPLPISAVLVLGGAVVVRGAAGSDVDGQLHRLGYPLVVLAGLALLARAPSVARGLVAVFGAVIGIIMVKVNVDRFPAPLPHNHYLYWDRYLFSEVFPMAVVLVALGATAAIEWATERWPATEGGPRAGPGGPRRHPGAPAAGLGRQRLDAAPRPGRELRRHPRRHLRVRAPPHRADARRLGADPLDHGRHRSPGRLLLPQHVARPRRPAADDLGGRRGQRAPEQEPVQARAVGVGRRAGPGRGLQPEGAGLRGRGRHGWGAPPRAHRRRAAHHPRPRHLRADRDPPGAAAHRRLAAGRPQGRRVRGDRRGGPREPLSDPSLTARPAWGAARTRC